jgi:type VI protein secretion system component VasF
LPGAQHDSAAKVRDQEMRKHDARVANWFAYVGILIVGVVVFVLWRMRLL